MSVHTTVTNELAQAVGTIARLHPETSLTIEWREGDPEAIWTVTANDHGFGERTYVVDDESGTHCPLGGSETLDDFIARLSDTEGRSS